jgi:hypothetical protein
VRNKNWLLKLGLVMLCGAVFLGPASKSWCDFYVIPVTSMTFKGDWDVDTVYNAKDVVFFNGSSWFSKVGKNTGTHRRLSTYWACWPKASGTTGPMGPAGPRGLRGQRAPGTRGTSRPRAFRALGPPDQLAPQTRTTGPGPTGPTGASPGASAQGLLHGGQRGIGTTDPTYPLTMYRTISWTLCHQLRWWTRGRGYSSGCGNGIGVWCHILCSGFGVWGQGYQGGVGYIVWRFVVTGNGCHRPHQAAGSAGRRGLVEDVGRASRGMARIELDLSGDRHR